MLTQLCAFPALTLHKDWSFFSSSFTVLSFNLAWNNSQSGTSSLVPCHTPGHMQNFSLPCFFLPCHGKAWLSLTMARAQGFPDVVLQYCKLLQDKENVVLALGNLVPLDTETSDHLFLFGKLVETATFEESATGVPETQKYFHLITQPGTVGLVKFLYLHLCLLFCLLRNATAAERFKKIFSPYKKWKYQALVGYLKGEFLV